MSSSSLSHSSKILQEDDISSHPRKNNDNCNKKKKNKPRYSRAQKRARIKPRAQSEGDGEEKEPSLNRKAKPTTKPNLDEYDDDDKSRKPTIDASTTFKHGVTYQRQDSWRDDLFQCVLRAEHTKSVRLVHRTRGVLRKASGYFSLDPKEGGNGGVDPVTVQLVTSCHTLSSRDTIPKSTTLEVQAQPLLILDLNGVLCHRRRHRGRQQDELTSSSNHNNSDSSFRPSLGQVANTQIIPRPHLVSWLYELDRHFCLAVWTSAQPKTARKILRLLVPPDLYHKFLFVWSQDDCLLNRNDDGPSIFEKHLSQVWNKFPVWNASNTIMVDDSPEKCPVHQAANVLHPPSLQGRRQRVGISDVEIVAKKDTIDSEEENNDDEDNHKTQSFFFQQMIQYWQDHPTCCTAATNVSRLGGHGGSQSVTMKAVNPPLYDFLKCYATPFMGWRGASDEEMGVAPSGVQDDT